MIMMQVLCISSVYLPSKFVLQLLTFHLDFQTGVIDMENDWKLRTLLIGGNDLCGKWVICA